MEDFVFKMGNGHSNPVKGGCLNNLTILKWVADESLFYEEAVLEWNEGEHAYLNHKLSLRCFCNAVRTRIVASHSSGAI
jgi:hypothetical protein